MPVRGFILDVTGVLYNSAGHGDGRAIAGSVEAVRRLYAESRVCFLSNESTSTREKLHKKLTRLGFEIRQEDILLPGPVAAEWLRREGHRPFTLVHPDVKSEFETTPDEEATCVLVGDAEDEFTYDNMNRAFRVLLRAPLLVSLGVGKFYQRVDGPCLDVGAFAHALEFASNAKKVTFGKPSKDYFEAAIAKLDVPKEEIIMIGDDIISDVGGAQAAGIRGAQVRTGKWRDEWAKHPTVKPDFIFDDLASGVNTLLSS